MESSLPNPVQSQGNSKSQSGGKGQEKSSDEQCFMLPPSPERTRMQPGGKRERQVLPRESHGEKNPRRSNHCTQLNGRKTEPCDCQGKEKQSELLVTIAHKKLEAHHLRLRDSKRGKQEFEFLESFRG